MKVLFEKAEEAYSSASIEFESRHYDAVVNRAYYCVFYCEKMLILTEGVSGDSHKHTHNNFDRLFVKSGKFEKDTSKKIQELMQKRHVGDYHDEILLSEEDAEFAMNVAQHFLEKTKAYLKKQEKTSQ